MSLQIAGKGTIYPLTGEKKKRWALETLQFPLPEYSFAAEKASCAGIVLGSHISIIFLLTATRKPYAT